MHLLKRLHDGIADLILTPEMKAKLEADKGYQAVREFTTWSAWSSTDRAALVAKAKQLWNSMTGLEVGKKVRVHYLDGEFAYTLCVEVVEIHPPNNFIGCVEAIRSNWGERGEVTRGRIVDELKGQKKNFRNEDIIY